MKNQRKFFVKFLGFPLLAAMVPGSCRTASAETQLAAAPLTKDQTSKLLQNQPIVANFAIFSGDSFPKIDYLNKDLITAALGAYTLKIRYFDSAWNEVQKPDSPGRYGALVDIHFPSGAATTEHLTLFKTSATYQPAKDPYGFVVQFPSAFDLSKEVVQREQWNWQNSMRRLMDDDLHGNEDSGVLLAAMHDLEADPARWHGFNCRRIDDAWWTTLRKKLGESQDYPRLVRLPDDYDKTPAKRWPLILFLHGSGERGNDLNKIKNQGPQAYIRQGHPLPFIVVSPQCPEQRHWNPEQLLPLIDQIEAAYRVDPKRIYVTGLSMGGIGTYDLAATYPEKVAAIAPLSGWENPEITGRLKGVPVWIFHGADDNVVPTRYSIEMADHLKKAGANYKLTIYPGVGHGGWDKTYADPALYEWFLQFALK